VSTIPPAGDPRWHYRSSLASRVTLLTTMAVGLTVAFVAAGAYLTVRMQMQSTLDDSLVQRAQSASVSELCGREYPPFAFLQAANIWVACLDSGPSGVVSDRVPFQFGNPEIAVWRGMEHESIRTIEGLDRSEWRVVAVHHDTGQTVVIAQSLDSQETVLRKLGIVMFLFGLAGVIAAGMAGWAVARNGLRPVRRLTASVEMIARTEDLRPLPVEGDDEIARLATAFNQMLAALAASRERQRQLVADAGHELRTPLTSLRTNLDLLSQADSSGAELPPEARAELLDDVRAQIEELTTLIGDLMELARDEPLTHVVEEVDVPELVDRAVGRVRRRAPGVTFDVETEPWFVVGEGAGLERAVTNLLDNAAKWSPPGGTVHVRLEDGVLTVDDEGTGIAEEDLPHVFDRFYRSEDSRSMPGSGLGLSIVRQVAERHSGTVEVGTSPAGGARLVLWLPGSRAPVPDWTPAP
jgi:two-component system sensor histidine kinase MprB